MKQYDAFQFNDLLLRDVKRHMSNIVLISSSKDRESILKSFGLEVFKSPVTVEEDTPHFGNPKDIVINNANIKYEAFRDSYDLSLVAYPIISADTIIALPPSDYSKKSTLHFSEPPYEIIGKPKDKKDAFKTLDYLIKRKKHLVYTGVLFGFHYNDFFITYDTYDFAVVEFKEHITDDEIADYIDTDEWIGTAGAHKIDGKGKNLVKAIYGDINTIKGLGLKSLYEAMNKMDYLFYI